MSLKKLLLGCFGVFALVLVIALALIFLSGFRREKVEILDVIWMRSALEAGPRLPPLNVRTSDVDSIDGTWYDLGRKYGYTYQLYTWDFYRVYFYNNATSTIHQQDFLTFKYIQKDKLFLTYWYWIVLSIEETQ